MLSSQATVDDMKEDSQFFLSFSCKFVRLLANVLKNRCSVIFAMKISMIVMQEFPIAFLPPTIAPFERQSYEPDRKSVV